MTYSYRITHDDESSTLEGLAKDILTLRWIDMEALVCGLKEQGSDVSADCIRNWAERHMRDVDAQRALDGIEKLEPGNAGK